MTVYTPQIELIDSQLQKHSSESRNQKIFHALEEAYSQEPSQAFVLHLSRALRSDDVFLIRALSFFVAEKFDLSGARNLSLRWLLEHQIDDTATLLNSIEAIYRTIGDAEAVPKLAHTALGPFFIRALGQGGTVAFSALHALDLLGELGALEQVFTQSMVLDIFSHLSTLRSAAEEDEMVQIDQILRRSPDSFPEYVTSFPEEMVQLRFGLKTHLHEVFSICTEVAEYCSVVEHRESSLNQSSTLKRAVWGIRLSKPHLPQQRKTQQEASQSPVLSASLLSTSDLSSDFNLGSRILPTANILHKVLVWVNSLVRTIVGDETDGGILRALPAMSGSYVQGFVLSRSELGEKLQVLLCGVIQATQASAEIDTRSPTLTQHHVDCYFSLIEAVLEEGLAFESVLVNGAATTPLKSAYIAAGKRHFRQTKKILIESRLNIEEKIDSADVPQADDIGKVLDLVRFISGHVDEPELQSRLGLSSRRQVNYYKAAARILGLLDEDNNPSERALSLQNVNKSGSMQALAVFFENTTVCRAWMKWSRTTRLNQLDSSSAEAFLSKCCADLSQETGKRRSKTLRSWVETLSKYHYAVLPAVQS